MLRKLLLTVLSVVYATILSAQVSDEILIQGWEYDAKRGDKYALFNLGLAYDLGKHGCPVDKAKAVEYYTRAAEGWNASIAAKVNLGVMYANGEGVEKNMKEAFELWDYAAVIGGDSLGCYYAGLCYLNGDGVKRDVIKGIDKIYKSAKKGYKRADMKLRMTLYTWEHSNDPQELYDYGYCYLHGTDTTQVDTAKALTYFQRAVDLGGADGEFIMGLLHLLGKQVDQNENLAVGLLERSASKGNAWAQTYLGLLYELGYPMKADSLQALSLYKVAASQDFLPAKLILASRHGQGGMTDKLYEDASWILRFSPMYRKDGIGEYIQAYTTDAYTDFRAYSGALTSNMEMSAQAGFKPAQLEYGMIRYGGYHSTKKNEKEGLYWLKTAGDAGYLPAQYQYEYLPAKDWEQRYALSLKYAEMGVKDAQYDYAQHMRYDRQADWVEAAKWYEAAAEQGDTESMKKLGEIYKQGGFKLKKDWSIALMWFENYVKIIAYDYDVLYTIGDIYAKGDKTVMKDPDKAIKYYLRAYNCALYESKRKDMIKKLKKLGYKIQ